jgi:hypothetical protein
MANRTHRPYRHAREPAALTGSYVIVVLWHAPSLVKALRLGNLPWLQAGHWLPRRNFPRAAMSFQEVTATSGQSVALLSTPYHGVMTGARSCEQCGAAFEPRREHERFCSARCRLAWNGENAGSQQAAGTALSWSVSAMANAAQRLAGARAMDVPQALAVVSEAVWWVTIVDATMIRYHPGAYDRALARMDPAARRVTEGTFAGLRFVRNQMGYHADPAGFVQPQPAGAVDAQVAAWTWKPVPAPDLGLVPPRGRAWEVSRYRQYRDQLAGRPVGESIGRAATFLIHLHEAAGQPGHAGAHAALQTGVAR